MASNKLRTRITYTPEVVDQMAAPEIRAAYSKLRHIAYERVKRMEKYGYQNRKLYKKAQEELYGLPTMGGLSDADVAQLLLDTSAWLRNPLTKISVQQKKDRQIIQHLREKGYKFINKSNVYDFLEFLNDMGEAYAEKNYDYEKIVDVYNQAARLQIPETRLRDEFETFMANRSKLPDVQLTGNPNADSAAISKALGIRVQTGEKSKVKLPRGQKAEMTYKRKRKYGK